MNVTVNLTRQDRRTAWEIARAVFEGFDYLGFPQLEVGSDCIEHFHSPGGGEGWTHNRLDITVTVYQW